MNFKFFLTLLIYVFGVIFIKINFISSTALIVGFLPWKHYVFSEELNIYVI